MHSHSLSMDLKKRITFRKKELVEAAVSTWFWCMGNLNSVNLEIIELFRLEKTLKAHKSIRNAVTALVLWTKSTHCIVHA